jgi:3-deoxy-D-manno-octulosonic-acid transferase
MFLLYSFLLTIAFVLLSPLLILRSGKYLAGFRQRLGFIPKFDPEDQPVVWLHCVSVGETQAARPLVTELKKELPDHKLVISTTTRTGQKLAKEVFADEADLVFYFPYDWRNTVRRSLRRIKPKVVLLMETEIWFNFIREAGKQEIKIAIVNGRLSERSAARYKWITNTFRRVFHYVDLAMVQTAADAKRFLAFAIRGTKVRVTGNLKFDQEFSPAETALTDELKTRFDLTGDVPLIIAASTHSPEEKWILEAFGKLWKESQTALPRLMLVPRHPERFAEVAGSIKETGFSWVRRSEKPSARDKTSEVILLDSIGELRAAYPLADIVFVGGSLIPHGGQNVLEPAGSGKAIVTGIHTMNFTAIIDEFLSKDALIQLPQLKETEIPSHLAETFSTLLQNHKRRLQLGENALNVAEANRGATKKTVASIKSFFET